jgi:hypothetical protein
MGQGVTDRRPTRGLNNRVREPIGRHRPDRLQDDNQRARPIESADVSPETMERLAELLGQIGECRTRDER